MPMPAIQVPWTVDMLDDLPDDGNRYEIIDGELFVTPAPSEAHQAIALELASRLKSYLRPSTIARARISPADVRRPDREHNRFQPDVFAVRLIDGKAPAYPYEVSDLLLAVEISSPSNADYDVHTKRLVYLNGGVPEYWIVDPDARTIARWRSAADPGDLFTDRIEWHPEGMTAPFTLVLREFFEDALG